MRRALLPLLWVLPACPTSPSGDDDDAEGSISHQSPAAATEAQDLMLTVTAVDYDGAVRVHVVDAAGVDLSTVDLVSDGAGGLTGTLLGTSLDHPAVEYWLEAVDEPALSQPEGAPEQRFSVPVADAPITEPTAFRARWVEAEGAVQLSWHAPPAWDFVSWSVLAEPIAGGAPEEQCAGLPDTDTCVAAGTWGDGYTNWFLRVDDGDGGAPVEVSASTDSIWNHVDTWAKETTVDDPLPFGTAAGEFNLPIAIVASPTRVYVAEQQNHRVQMFDDAGQYLGRIGAVDGTGVSGTGNAEFNSPSDVTLDGEGRLLVADFVNARIHLIQADGQFVRTFGSLGTGEGQLRFPTSVAVDGSGQIHVAESVNHRVSIFDGEGNFLQTYDTVAGRTLGSNNPRLHWSTSRSAMLITDGRQVLIRGSSAEEALDLLDASSASSLAGLCENRWGEILVAVDGNQQVGDGVDGHHVRVYDDSWNELGRLGGWGDAPDSMLGPSDCFVDEGGIIAVTDGRNHRVHLFGP